ncbi:MAG: hypothetical protein IKO41_17840 [Lachnospiraceae bacterium]|nr:hypothetical protein [Lachnospiraceae bacterium]
MKKYGKRFCVGERIFKPCAYGFKEVIVTSVTDKFLEVKEPCTSGAWEMKRYPVHLSEARGHYGDQCVTWGIWDGLPHVGYATNSVKGGVPS